MITMELPNPQVMAAIGGVAIRHGQLDYSLKMAVRSLQGLSIKDCIADTKRQMSSKLRNRVLTLAKERFGAGKAFSEIEALVTRAKNAALRRNSLLHGLWAKNSEGELLHRDEGVEFYPIPTISELDNLAEELIRVANDLHFTRTTGSFKEALEQHPLHLRNFPCVRQPS